MDKFFNLLALTVYLAALAVLAKNWKGVGSAINNVLTGWGNLLGSAKS